MTSDDSTSCHLCFDPDEEVVYYDTDDEFWSHIEDEHPEVPLPDEASQMAADYRDELVEITERLDDIVEEYWEELPWYARQLRVKDEVEGAANRTGRASWEIDRLLSEEGDSQ